jgi:hypothetical protein
MGQRTSEIVRYIILVSRREPDLYEYLRRRFEEDPQVDVVLDRRRDDRRRRDQPRELNRRQGERRRRTPDSLRSLGSALVRRAQVDR